MSDDVGGVLVGDLAERGLNAHHHADKSRAAREKRV